MMNNTINNQETAPNPATSNLAGVMAANMTTTSWPAKALIGGRWRPTRQPLPNFFAAIMFAMVTVCAGLSYGQIDTVVKVDGKTRISGKLQAMTADLVTLSVRNSETTIPTQEIDHIRFNDEPSRMNQAREAISNRQFDQAEKELSGMKWDTSSPNTVLDGMYSMAVAKTELALAGTPGHSISDAVAQVRKFQEDGKNHFRYYPSLMLYGRLGKASNRLNIAKDSFGPLAGVTDQTVALKANLELGFIALLEKDYATAKTAFDKAASFDVNDPESTRLKSAAKLSAAVAVAGLGKADQAEEMLKKAILTENPEDSLVNGFAYNALGNVYLIAGKTKDAEAAFLHTDLLFMANSEAHPEALYRLIQIWTQMGKTDRASEAKSKLTSRYGGTYWAQVLSQ